MRRSQRVLPIVLALALVTGALLAQGTTSALTGRVIHDGAGLPGVTSEMTGGVWPSTPVIRTAAKMTIERRGAGVMV